MMHSVGHGVVWTCLTASGIQSSPDILPSKLSLCHRRGQRPALTMSAPNSSPWVSFPFLSSAGKCLMEEIGITIEKALSSSLQPSRTPPDVRSFKNAQGNGEGSITIRSGTPGSKIDFVLGSWLHCNLPFGSLNIATLIGMINEETDAPHLLFEFIQTGADSLVLVLDLLPRKDLVLHPEYLKRFYEDTALETVKKELERASQAQRYEPPTLYIRCVTSPTAIMYKLNGQTEPVERGLDRIIEDAVYPAAKQVVKVWLEGLANTGRKAPDEETQALLERDVMIKTKGVEVDLSSNMPRLFGQEIADRVVEAFRRGE